MPFEPTTKENLQQLTKNQHFHMRAIIERFSKNGKVKVHRKDCSTPELLNSDDECFIGKRAWSHETEIEISSPIERRFLGQVKSIEKTGSITDHNAISDYHQLWYLRWHFATNQQEDHNLFPGLPCGSWEKDIEEYIEKQNRVPLREGGKIASRFKNTLEIKQLLSENKKQYDRIKWQIVESAEGGFISSDTYQHSLFMAISPKYILIGGSHINVKRHEASKEEIEELNSKSTSISQNFYFYPP